MLDTRRPSPPDFSPCQAVFCCANCVPAKTIHRPHRRILDVNSSAIGATESAAWANNAGTPAHVCKTYLTSARMPNHRPRNHGPRVSGFAAHSERPENPRRACRQARGKILAGFLGPLVRPSGRRRSLSLRLPTRWGASACPSPNTPRQEIRRGCWQPWRKS